MCISVVGLVVLFVVDRVGARFFFRAIFVFNATATTEIYTYGHTLSLHDALPIYLAAFVGGGFRFLPDQIGDRGVETGLVFRLRGFGCGLLRRLFVARRGQRPAERIRSEEHTSELQSLMRISYAVFCLKKKKITTTNSKTTTKQNNNHNSTQ